MSAWGLKAAHAMMGVMGAMRVAAGAVVVGMVVTGAREMVVVMTAETTIFGRDRYEEVNIRGNTGE